MSQPTNFVEEALQQQFASLVIAEERKLNFDHISPEDEKLFRVGLSPDGKLSLSAFEYGTSPEITSIKKFLQNNPQVTHFRWGGADVSDSEFSTLVGIPSLKSLELPECTQVTGVGMQALSGNATLESLTLLSCGQMTNAVCRYFATMKGLQSLVLDVGARTIDLSILASIPELKSLTLFCKHVVQTTAVPFPKLESLKLMGANLTDKALQALLDNNPSLKRLKLNACTGVSDAAKAKILQEINGREEASNSPELTYLRGIKQAAAGSGFKGLLDKQPEHTQEKTVPRVKVSFKSTFY